MEPIKIFAQEYFFKRNNIEQTMSDIVFILGAGASRMAGGPLMSDFLSSSDDLLRAGRVDDKREDFERVSKAIGKLRYVHSKSNLNTANILKMCFQHLKWQKL